MTTAVDFHSLEEILIYLPSSLRGSAPADLFLQEPAPAPAVAPTDSAAAESSGVVTP